MKSIRKHRSTILDTVSKGALFGTVFLVSNAAHAGARIPISEEGYVNLDYTLQVWAQNESYTSDDNAGSSFDTFLRRNRITLSGQVDDRIGFYAQLEAGGDGENGENDESVYFRDAYVTFDYSDQLRLIGGKFKNTFSRENLEACLEPLTLDRSEISYTPFGGTRDTGAALWGNLADAKLQYRLMIADGRESEYVPKKSPRVTARVHWSALEPEYDYGYRGTYLGTRKVLTFGAAVDYQADAAYSDYAHRQGKQDYFAWTADAFFEYPFSAGTATLSAAYLDYDLGEAINQQPDPELPANTQLTAYYVKGGYLLPQKVWIGRLQLFARHDQAEYGLDSGYLDNSLNAAGLNYYIDGQKLKLTLEYTQIDYDRPVPDSNSLSDNWRTTIGFQFIL